MKPDKTTERQRKPDPTAEYERLRAENARLIALLNQHGIPHPDEVTHATIFGELPHFDAEAQPHPLNLSTKEKVALFARLFRGRTDVYPVRWEGKDGRSGYAPACANEWKPGICEKPRIKCAECGNRRFLPVTDDVIYGHLAGKYTVGVYPLMPDETCYFLAVDLDGAEWRNDARALVQTCRALEVPAALEISRSGAGAHVWIFFAAAVSSREARRLGSALISRTCDHTRQLKLSSYDRLFPNQDTMPKGGFGNLIALPLQKKPREEGRSVFVDDLLAPYPDQWSFLASIKPLAPERIGSLTHQATGGGHPLDVAFIADEDEREPWKRPTLPTARIPGPLPERIVVVQANQLFFDKKGLPQPLANRLIRLAAFQNPEFYRAQAMRLPVWDKPRVIGCAENHPRHIALPRGCLHPVRALLKKNGVRLDIRDERFAGQAIEVSFAGQLRPDQEAAAAAMLKHDIGVLCAPTAFGKTVTAAALIARRGVNTLILVHRTELLNQWRERLSAFLSIEQKLIGVIGGGNRKRTGEIDVAVMQSLSRKGKISDLVEGYGHVVVDECHHLSAFSFEAILKSCRAKYVLGLTATPIRRDGQHPIIFMQCGPIHHTAARPESAPRVLEVVPRFFDTQLVGDSELGIQEVFRQLAADRGRNDRIVADVLSAYRGGRRVIVLTERTDHLDTLQGGLDGEVNQLFVLHGRMSRKQRAAQLSALEALPGETPRVLLATGRLVGEGFDHPPLDTLVLAMPISWKGTLQQYAGRLHRAHATKSDIRIYDYVDASHPALTRMWNKRQRGYRAMGYAIGRPDAGTLDLAQSGASDKDKIALV